MSNESSPKCPQCGAPLPEDAPKGLCPNCLMALNLKTETVFTDDTPAAQPPLPPEQIAPHFPQLEILECLGRGGMGVVYKTRQKSLNRLVALKLLAPERVRDAKFAERFAREAHALAALNHPNIVTIYDFGQAGGFYYLLMEFVDGVNLRQLLRARKFTPEEALAIVPPLCDALQFAHDRGIIHRDIKPENLLLDKVGRVKVADFGIAKMLGSVNGGGNAGESAAPENATQTAVGTPSYSAPEQKSDPQRVDSRADIYSLGVVFYEMLTGELPGKRIEPPSRKVQIDVRLDEVVLRALEKRPELRYQQVSEVKTMVETIVGSAAAPAAPVDAASTGTAGKAFDEASNAAREARALPEPHFSRTAIMGAGCFGLVLCLVFVGTIFLDFWSGTGRGVPEVLFVFWPSLELSLLIAGTILGWISVTQIRRSAGKLYGLWLAVFDALFFPLLALDGAIGWLWLVLAKLFARQVLGLQNSLFLDLWDLTIWISLALASAALVDWLIIRAIWRAVNKGSAGVLPAEPGVAPGRAERELKRGGIVLVGRRNGQRVIVWRGVANTFFAISGCVLITLLLLRFFMPIGTQQMITFMSFAVLLTAGGIIMGFRTPIEQLTPLDNSPSGSGGRPAGYEQRRRKLAWKLLMASWACLAAVLVIKGVQWWSKYEPAGVWIPSPINGSISGEYGEAWLHITEVSLRGQVVLMAITCETPYPDRGLFVQYSGPSFGFPADIASAETNLDILKSPTFMSGPGGGRTLVGSDLLKGKSVYQIGFVLPDAATAAKVVEQVKAVHLGKPRGLDQNKCVLDLFQLHRHVGEKTSGQPVTENLTAMLVWQPKRDSTPNPKPVAAQNFSFGPVIQHVLTNFPAMIAFDSDKVVIIFPGETGTIMDKDGRLNLNRFGARISNRQEYMKQEGLDFIYEPPFGTFVDYERLKKLRHADWDGMSSMQLRQTIQSIEVNDLPQFHIDDETNAAATYAFETREGGMGILQITGFTENPRGVKLRYKLVQTMTAPPTTPASALQFRLVSPEGSTEPADWLPDMTGLARFHVLREVLLDGSAVAQAGVDFDPDGRRIIEIQFTDAGRRQLAEITGANIQRQLAIVFLGKVLSAPIIQSRIPSGESQIAGIVNQEELYSLVDCLNRTITPSDQAWKFAAPCEKILPFHPGPTPVFGWLDLDSGTVLTNTTLDWKNHAGHEWIKANGLDVVTTESSKHLPVLLGIDTIITPAPTNGWNIVTAADVIHNWTLLKEEPQRKQVLGAVPGQSDTFFFQTREGGKGVMQILGFADNPHGVKIRYKLVQNVSVVKNDSATISALLSEPPKLQFLAWQDEWKTNQPGAARHPDGSPVTDAIELEWLKAVSSGGMDVSSWHLSPEPRFLKLWFSHPLFGQGSFNEVTLLDDQNNVIPLDARGSMAGDAQDANGQNGNLGWLTKTLSPGAGTNIPRRVNVRLRYTVGPLEKTSELAVESRHRISMALEGNSQLNGVGQDVDGRAFVALAIDAGKMNSRRFGVVAVTKDGRELTVSPSESGSAGETGVSVAEYNFGIPLADVAKFIIGTRPIRTNEWKDVVLPEN